MSFIDLHAQRRRLEPGLSAAIADVMEQGFYIGGPKVQEAEAALAAFCGAGHAVACASGTDALLLVLMAWGTGPGDAVFVPAFTFAAAPAVAVRVGATPVFVDVDRDSFNMDPRSFAAAVEQARADGLTPRVVIPVDLFGQPAEHAAIEAVAATNGLAVLSDAAQSFGASYRGRMVGTIGAATATSFYPSKPLAVYGDGGAIFTDDDELAGVLRSLRDHGQGSHRYDHVRIGINSRLDALQAAVLLEKLKIFPDELARRQRVADRYRQGLADAVAVPLLAEGVTSSWAQYTLRAADRDAIAATCRDDGIPTAIHYPLPATGLAPFRQFPVAPGGVPVAEELARTVISLPMHPYLSEAEQDRVVASVLHALGAGAEFARADVAGADVPNPDRGVAQRRLETGT